MDEKYDISKAIEELRAMGIHDYDIALYLVRDAYELLMGVEDDEDTRDTEFLKMAKSVKNLL